MSSGKFVFLLTAIFLGWSGLVTLGKDVKKYPLFYVSILGVTTYVLAQVILVEDSDFGMLSRLVVILAYGFFMASAVSKVFVSTSEFIKCLAIACLIQTIMVYISFISEGYRIWLSNILVETSNIPLNYASRVAGFSNSSGSQLSLILSMGSFCFMSLYYVSKKKIEKIFCFSMSLFVVLSCIFVGKLGLFLGFYFIFIILFFDFFKHPGFNSGVFFVLFLFVATFFTFASFDSGGYLSYALTRTFSLFLGQGDSSLDALLEMPIPKLDLDTLLGFSSTVGEYGGNASGSDVGYIQTYYSLGLVFTIIFYLSLFMYLIAKIYSLPRNKTRTLAFILFLPLFIVDLKEPFISKLGYFFVLYTFIILSSNEKLAFIKNNGSRI